MSEQKKQKTKQKGNTWEKTVFCQYFRLSVCNCKVQKYPVLELLDWKLSFLYYLSNYRQQTLKIVIHYSGKICFVFQGYWNKKKEFKTICIRLLVVSDNWQRKLSEKNCDALQNRIVKQIIESWGRYRCTPLLDSTHFTVVSCLMCVGRSCLFLKSSLLWLGKTAQGCRLNPEVPDLCLL